MLKNLASVYQHSVPGIKKVNWSPYAHRLTNEGTLKKCSTGHWAIKNRQEPKKIVLYARVSSAGQKPDLENQLKYLKDFTAGKGLTVDEILSDVGSALNYKRKNFLKLRGMVTRGEVKTIIVAHKDRLVRFGFDFFEDLFAKFGCEILVVNKAEDMSPAQELTEDLISIVQHFAAKLYGQRTYKARKLTKTVREALSSAADGKTKEPAPEQK